MTKSPDITPELQIEINRAEWIQALRENGHRQSKKGWMYGFDEVCALGLALELGGFPKHSGLRFTNAHRWLGSKFSQDCLTLISGDNDKGWTFVQIADAAKNGRYWDLNG